MAKSFFLLFWPDKLVWIYLERGGGYSNHLGKDDDDDDDDEVIEILTYIFSFIRVTILLASILIID